MKNLFFIVAVAVTLMCSAFTVINAVSWKIQEGYTIKFVSDDPTGVFQKMDGSIQFDEQNLANSSFDVKVEVGSINTGNGMQNKHAISDKWFDAEAHPYIRFQSQKFEKTAEGYTVSGTMEIKGVSKPFEIPFTFEDNVFSGTFPVNRLDFGIGEPHKKVPDVMSMEVTVPVSK